MVERRRTEYAYRYHENHDRWLWWILYTMELEFKVGYDPKSKD